MSWKADTCIYHFPCNDGLGSALVASMRWPGIELCETNYNCPIPSFTGKKILIADFSYPRTVLEDLSKRVEEIVVLDHHKTSEESLTGCPRLEGDSESLESFQESKYLVRFDSDRSGVGLTWDFCFPGREMPWMLKRVEDRDLWRFALPESKAVHAFLSTIPRSVPAWHSAVEAFEHSDGRDAQLAEGYAVLRFTEKLVKEIVRGATFKRIKNFKVPVAHTPHEFASEVGNALLDAYPAAPFAAAIVDAFGGRTYSLRSRDDREDVSAVAAAFGGGGHRNSAGFRVPAP